MFPIGTRVKFYLDKYHYGTVVGYGFIKGEFENTRVMYLIELDNMDQNWLGNKRDIFISVIPVDPSIVST